MSEQVARDVASHNHYRRRALRRDLIVAGVAAGAVSLLAALPAGAVSHSKQEKKITLSNNIGSAWARLKAPKGLHIHNLTFTNCGDHKVLYFQPAGQPDAIGTGIWSDNKLQADRDLPTIWLPIGQPAIASEGKTLKQPTNPNFTVAASKSGQYIVHLIAGKSSALKECQASFSAPELKANQQISMIYPDSDRHEVSGNLGFNPADNQYTVPIAGGGVATADIDNYFFGGAETNAYGLLASVMVHNKDSAAIDIEKSLCFDTSPWTVCPTATLGNQATHQNEATVDGASVSADIIYIGDLPGSAFTYKID